MLTSQRLQRANELTNKIRDSQQVVWDALVEIHADKLYKDMGYTTMAKWASGEFKWKRDYLQKQVAAAKTKLLLAKNVYDSIQPTHETQLRPLTKLEDKEKIEAWELAVEKAGGAPTEKIVDEAVREVLREVVIQQPDVVLPPSVETKVGDFRDLMAELPDESIDMIFTDPPYEEKYLGLYATVAQEGARVLKSGGSLIVYAGHYAIPQITNMMSAHLRYWWIICLYQGSPAARLLGKNVYVHWKPLLWFVKDRRGTDDIVGDYFVSPKQDKTLEPWAQDVSDADYLINHLTEDGATILDPMCGTGTTLIAALMHNRNAIGYDVNEEQIAITRQRVWEYLNGTKTQANVNE